MKTTPKHYFDRTKHQYFLDGRAIPSVTQILREVIGGQWQASDWHLGKGRAVHACCAFIATRKQFSFDPAITGQVSACKKFFADLRPATISAEKPVFCHSCQFAGTPDLYCTLKGKTTIIDWKSSFVEVAELQLAGYGILLPNAQQGLVVALLESGQYKCGKLFPLHKRKNEFMACLSVFNLRQRLGLVKSKEVSNGS